MRHAVLAAAVLMAAVAACGAEGAEQSTTPVASETDTEVAVVPEGPSEAPDTGTAALTGTPTIDAPCGADKLDRWLNVLPTANVKAKIAAAVGERPIRYYTQGDPITMDFSEARLNVELGADGRIKLFRCG